QADYDGVGTFLGIVFVFLNTSIVPNGIIMFCTVFVADIPKHHCLIPEVNLLSQQCTSIIWLPCVVNGKLQLSSCSRYRLDVVTNLSAQGFVPSRDVKLTDLEQEGCVDGWNYGKHVYQSTIVTEVSLIICLDVFRGV
uniref:Uncharacterized protein n=1 Tax=Mola mola TaxID=94237 RepID=A0A3Q3WRZ7_MOLML